MPALRSSVAAAAAVRSSRRATPPSPSAGARSTPFTERLEQRAAHDVFDIPTTPRGNMRNLSVGSTCRPPGAQAFGAERVARGSNSAAPGARVCSAYAIGAERVARGGARSQRLPARRTGRAGVLVAPGRAGAQGAEPLGGPAQRLAPGRAGVQGAEPLGLLPCGGAQRVSLGRGTPLTGTPCAVSTLEASRLSPRPQTSNSPAPRRALASQ